MQKNLLRSFLEGVGLINSQFAGTEGVDTEENIDF
jgi:hypothetical protein